VIRTERLLLRRWRDADHAPFAAMNADPVVREHFPGTLSTAESSAAIERMEAHWRSHAWGLWAVEVAGVAPFVGFVGLWPADHVTGEPMVEVGWRLARGHWGHGYASEGAREALRFGFDDLGLDEIISFTSPANVRSRRVMERIGLVHDPSRDFDNAQVDPVAYPHLVRQVLYRSDRAAWLTRRDRP
jgi:ribosomal-protein-alanine N-acetyltransferase